MFPSFFLPLIFLYGLLAHAQSPFQPGYIPLAVKTPYLHVWINSTDNNGLSPAGVWPNFVLGNRIFGWAGMIRVDNQAYWWLGGNSPNLTTATVAREITPTKSTFRLGAGPIQFSATFFSPIEPNDYVRQSMPFSYMYIDEITVSDSKSHTIQVYSDITAEWVTKDDNTIVKWDTTEMDNTVFHRIAKQQPTPMTETDGISEDATGYFATAKRSGLTWQTSSSNDLRTTFSNNGSLRNSSDNFFRKVTNDSSRGESDWPAFGLSIDLGTVSPGGQMDPVVWSVGLVRDPLVIYAGDQSQQNRSAYYWSKYTNASDVLSAFISDFSDALSRSLDLDKKVLSAASNTSPEYASILSLVSRQIFASMDITIPSAQSGRFDNTDVKIFMKDIGSSLRTNPVEGIYGAFPALVFFNASFARDLLQPLLEFQFSSRYLNPYAASDLGGGYPSVQGNYSAPEPLAIESCGSMLIMMYTYAAKSGDSTLLSRYYPMLQHWADYLIDHSLHPRGSITADGIDLPSMSNLALKGILGVYSMAKITEAIGVSNATYLDHATQLISDWKGNATATDGHIEAAYGSPDSWGLIYNLFPAVWLGMGLIQNEILDSQVQYYAQKNFPEFGLSLDSSQGNIAYPHWTLMTAGAISNSSTTTRDKLIEPVYKRATLLNAPFPLPVRYDTSNGEAKPVSGYGSPILGAAFAMAALSINNVLTQSPPIGPSGGSHRKSSAGAIVGGVIGGLSFILLVAGTIFIWKRHKHITKVRSQHGPDSSHHNVDDYTNGMVGSSFYQNSDRSEQALNTNPSSPLLSTSTAAVPPPVMSRKQREALHERSAHTRNEPAPSSPPASMAGDFRAEVEQLRREINSIRHTTEAPPSYGLDPS